MNILVVYDSECKSTECVAQVIADTLEQNASVIIMPVEKAGPLPLGNTVHLLILGGLTPRLREWLDRLPSGALFGIPVATFDTRMQRLPSGSSACGTALTRLGAALAVPPQTFYTPNTPGLLDPCELEQASNWAEVLLWKMQQPRIA